MIVSRDGQDVEKAECSCTARGHELAEHFGCPLLDFPNRNVVTWSSCPKIHSSTSQVPTDSKTH